MINADRIYVKPRAILGPDSKPTGEVVVVRDEYTLEPIPADGAWVKLTRLVHRRLRDAGEGADLMEAEPQPEQKAETEAPVEAAPEPAGMEPQPEQPARRRGKNVEPSTESEG